MARKASADSDSPPRGFSDIVGFALLVTAVLLLFAQFSFDRGDIGFIRTPANRPLHNWIGTLGAYFAWSIFFLFGVVGYIVPLLLAMFGAAYLLGFLNYLCERIRWSLLWSAVLLIALTGLFYLAGEAGLLGDFQKRLGIHTVGGFLGSLTYGQTKNYDFGFALLGPIGATIVYAALGVVSVIFLTGFRLGEWLQSRMERTAPAVGEEAVLERKARDLQKQAKKLQEEVDRSKPGIGADLQPVPEPTVRDLSISPSKGAPRTKKSESPADSPIVQEGEVITAREIAAASTSDVLGKGAEAPSDKQTSSAKEGEKVEGKADPVVTIADSTAPAPAAVRPKLVPRKPKPITVASTPMIGNYQLPTMDFLQHPDPNLKPTESKEELMANARLMQQTLAQFDIEVALGDITKGPTITRYELHPAPGVKLEKIQGLNNNLAAALKAERINILAPVPGKSSVGIEVPNLVKTKVIMRDLLESDEWRNSKARIPLALGKDVYGHPIIADLAEMPHCLIAGSTGSGKSVCINSIIASLLYKFSPDQLRFVMIDPKVVELQQYNALPHLVVPVVTDPKKVILALRWVVNEMEKRYQIFAKVGVRNIASFNSRPKNKPLPQQEPELPLMAKKEKVEPGAEGFAVEVDEEIVVPREDDIVIPEKLSYIVVIIDELADLMLVAPADVEMAIARITQMARAAGIHCIVATQRPSVDVITGVIKANIPARIAFQVAAKVDSRTILDAMGADKLLGKGDMLYLPPGSARLIRAQGALITDGEIQSVVDFIAKQAKPSYEVEIHQQLSKPVSTFEGEGGIDEDESLIEQCIEVIRSEQKASVSLMQRRLRLGYTRAARIMDELENRGIVGPSKGAEPRDILIDLDGGGADGAGQ
ncbi:MAG TPA: DNA translocase FtsK [Verrucomicrobiae bacterium]|nr:DNA translocase FtsK [Verrucomicrobiae bacterium]